MKKVIFMSLITLGFCNPYMAQNKSEAILPEIVLQAFNERFPDAKRVDWEQENDQEWEAEFKWNHAKYSANFDLKGKWLETEHEIEPTDIPANILNILDAYLNKQDYVKYEIEEAEIVESPSGIGYELELEVKNMEYEVYINPLGEIKMAIESEEQDED